METIINNQLPLDLDEGKRKRESELLQKTKAKKPNEEGEVNVRKKPGRKRLEVTESNTKKEKNRVAQRAWRERKEKYVLELEAKIAELENAKNKSESEKQQLKLIIEKLRSENTYLKNATSFIFTPTKETEMFMEQNKLKIQQQKNLKQSNQGLLNSTVSLTSQNSLTPELGNIAYDNSGSSDSISQLTANGLNETLLKDSHPEMINDIYKLINMENTENTLTNNQDSSLNPALLTPDSLLHGANSPLNPELVPASNSQLYNIISPLHKDDLIVPSEFELNNTVPNGPTDPNILLMMNNQNPNKNILLNQQQIGTTIDPALIGPSTSAGPIPAYLPNTTIDQNSLLTMSLLNNMQQPTLLSQEIPNIDNNVYQLNQYSQMNQPTMVKPVSGHMNYRTNQVKEQSQPINDAFFNNVIQMINQSESNEEEDIIQQINKTTEVYTNPLKNMPSPSIINYGKDYPSTPDELPKIPYTPEDIDSESNKSGDVIYSIPRGIDNENESENSFSGSSSSGNDMPAEVKVSTLQFPADQKPTKLNIPYSVFPRVNHETVDNFINDAKTKLTDEELECLCSELKNKATCKEKLKYIAKNVEIEGWTMEKWDEGRKKYLDEAKEKELKKDDEMKEERSTGNEDIKKEINVENK